MTERNPMASPPSGLANAVDDNVDENDSDTEWWDEEEKDSASQLKPANSVRVTQWPRPPGAATAEVPPTPPPKPTPKLSARANSRKPEKRYSVQKPLRLKSKGRQKKQNAQAGIKLVTNFSSPRVAKVASPPGTLDRSKPGCFVDLAALQALNGEPSQPSGGFWKSRKAKESATASNQQASIAQPVPASAAIQPAPAKPKGLVPSPLNLNDDLSPSDRPIVIGISIPSASLEKHAISPQTASSYTSKISHAFGNQPGPVLSPETPTIVITPADDHRTWSPLGVPQISRASSVYSQPQHDAFGIYQAKDAPPVPQMPAAVIESENQRIAAQKSYFSPDSDQGTMWGDDDSKFGSPSRARVTSTCTVFEEDESPVLARTVRARSISVSTKDDKHASVSTAATRQSKGWWNVIVTPFMTRSNTVTARGVFEDQQRPAVPSLTVASVKAAEAERDRKIWEKQFSPTSPLSSTTINSDAWWEPFDKDNLPPEGNRSGLSPVDQTKNHAPQPSSGTIPFVLSDAPQGRVERDFTASSPARTFEPSQPNFSLPRAPPAAVTAARGDSVREVQPLANANRGVSQNINPFVQPRLADLDGAPARAQPAITRATPVARAPQNGDDPTPPPPYSPAPRRYRAILPPGSTRGVGNAQESPYPASPGPVSPGLAAAMSSGGGIPMSNVHTSSVPRTPINLNSGYPELPPRGEANHFFPPPPTSGRKAEARRQRYEKEEAIAHKAGGLWRGRGCVSSRGCYGRRGAEGRKRRRWYLCLIIGFLALLTLIVVLATTLHRKSKAAPGPSQWLNLTGFPPIFTGLSTVAAPVNSNENTGCVVPATQWSCDLPPELQGSVAPNPPNRPNFILNIQWDNSSAANATFANVTGNPKLATRGVGNAVSAGHFIRYLLLKARQTVTFTPNPAPPSFADEEFLGSTTDGIVSSDKAGEPTPFYISFLSTTDSSKKRSTVSRRQPEIESRADNSSSPFPDIETIIPAPSLNSDGTAAPANLLPLPSQQPIRLYDRGLPTEHYGFYTYFDRSIFLKSITGPNKTNPANPDDANGGVKEADAAFRCTWAETRFLVQMWTRANSTTSLLNSTSSASFAPGKDFQQPGSFPYPITITLDRHGGDPKQKMVYCYALNDQGGLVATSGKIIAESRGFGGTLVNPAPTIFTNSSDPGLGGFDGGTGGCNCQWTNFQNVAQ